MSGYAKFMKELETKKWIVSNEPMDNLHHYSVISIRSLVRKKKDLRAFTVPCTIGPFKFEKALFDLGASIILMPLAVFKKLGLGYPAPINIQLLMADRSIKISIGILYDVLVKVENFFSQPTFEGIEEYDEIVCALTGMGSYSYAPKKLDLELKNHPTPLAKPFIEEPLEKLIVVPIIVGSDWSKPLEIMCDVSGVELAAVFGQKK
ncbi:uncharacterized protein LOC124886613 [Capsicum annuum]|uniref:uncharacterized protein LOC124886613 n=1 Tax=Capsicum annuum TaxID=4072 RepID=UPI001FB130B3|nr:uncharacterized protein LOC124886613 [Capsicum annuum]